jgi:hypothetical protein
VTWDIDPEYISTRAAQLLLQVMFLDALNNPTCIGYCVHEVSPNGIIRYGTFEQHLHPPPIVLKQNHAPNLVIGSFNYSVMQPDQVLENYDFIPNPTPQYRLSSIWEEEEEDGFDIYIDQIKNLPDNVSIVKCVAKVVNNKRKEVYSSQDVWPELDSTYLK